MAYDQTREEYEGQDLSSYKKMWQEFVTLYGDARKQHFRDEEYYDGDVKGTGWGQWTDTELAKLDTRGQPPSVRNMIMGKINSIAGVEQRTRSEPRAYPRNPEDQKASEIATDSLRFVSQQTRWSYLKADMLLEALKIGYSAVEITGAKNHVPKKRINWKEFFFDPRRRKHDFSDCRYLGIAKWLDSDVAKATFAALPPPLTAEQQQMPEAVNQYNRDVAAAQAAAQAIDDTLSGSSMTTEGDFEDLPNMQSFCDTTRKRIFVVDMWHKDPEHGWFRCVFTGSGKLFTAPADLVEPDDLGNPRKVHPIKAFSIYISREGWSYGEVRNMRPVQDDLNKRLSKALYVLTVNQVIMDKGAIPKGEIERVRSEVARPDGIIEKVPGSDFEIRSGGEMAQGQMELANEAREFLQLQGANADLQGQNSGAQSGRAILARQQAGLGALAVVFDRFADFELRVYRADWARIQQFWTGPMYVRVTDDKNAARFAAVNGAPVVNTDNGNVAGIGHNGGPPLTSATDGLDKNPPWTPQQMAGGAGALNGGMQPGGPQPGGMLNGIPVAGAPQEAADAEQPGEVGPMLAELDMDIIVDRAPEAATLQAEQFNELMKLAPVYAAQGQPIPLDILIEASALPNKSALIDKLNAAAQKPNPAAEAAAAKSAAELETAKGEVALMKAQVAEIMASIDKMKAETTATAAKADQTAADAAAKRAAGVASLATAEQIMVDPNLAAAALAVTQELHPGADSPQVAKSAPSFDEVISDLPAAGASGVGFDDASMGPQSPTKPPALNVPSSAGPADAAPQPNQGLPPGMPEPDPFGAGPQGPI